MPTKGAALFVETDCLPRNSMKNKMVLNITNFLMNELFNSGSNERHVTKISAIWLYHLSMHVGARFAPKIDHDRFEPNSIGASQPDNHSDQNKDIS